MTTIPVQSRLAASIVKLLDERARQAKTTRAEIVRSLLESALADPQPAPSTPATDPLVGRIADELGTLLARIDANLEAGRDAARNAAAAHAAAKLGALMLLPVDRQQAFIDKLTRAVQP
jgi:hypothetical protein